MTASKQDTSRPTSQHRLSVGSNVSSLPVRNSSSRAHSHSVSLGSTTSTHRVNRRKSSTFTPSPNVAAIGAAVDNAVGDAATAAGRRSSVSRALLGALNDGGHPPLPGSLAHVSVVQASAAVVDGPSLASFTGPERTKPKLRRASEGVRLTKKEKAATGDLKCEHCGKAYKHGSCLTKHLWEHTPQWQYTSKLLISKHQQVQLLEAASVLVAMNHDGHPAHDSDNSSSPAASGSSDIRDDDASSTETTPPPPHDQTYRDSKRHSNNSSAYSRSYQSIFSTSEGVPMAENGFAHGRNWSYSSSYRPVTAGTSIAESYRDEEPQDLAAAVGLLSCSYGTPKSAPIGMPSDVPPVPPLPAKYARSAFSRYRDQADVDMQDDGSSDDGVTQHDRIDEADEGLFGKMDA